MADGDFSPDWFSPFDVPPSRAENASPIDHHRQERRGGGGGGGGGEGTSDTASMSRQQSQGSDGQQSHPNVFVRGIPENWSEDELMILFKNFGKLTSLRIARRHGCKAHRGYGFVRYLSADDAQSAISALDGVPIGNGILQVKFADADAGPPTTNSSFGLTPCDTCYVKRVPVTFTKATLFGLFTKFGKVVDVKFFSHLDQLRGGSALVKMDSVQSAARAIQGLDGYVPTDSVHALIVRFAESTNEKLQRLERQQGVLTSLSLQSKQLQNLLTSIRQPMPHDNGSVLIPPPQHDHSGSTGTSRSTMNTNDGYSTVYFDNAPDMVDRLWIYEQFSKYGAIMSVSYNPTQRSGRIVFGTKEASSSAVAGFHATSSLSMRLYEASQ